jgi:hypothetical protein
MSQPKSIKVNEFTKGRKDKAFYVTDFLIKVTGALLQQGVGLFLLHYHENKLL